MVFVHSLAWWLIPEDQWLYFVFYAIFADIVAGMFVSVSGISAIISYRNRLIKAEISENYNSHMANKEYLFRGLIILFVALIYNCVVVITFNNFSDIWKWFIPLTIAISLLMGYLFLKTSKWFRLLFSVIIWIINYIIVSPLLSFEGHLNFFGILFHVLYNSLDLHPILYYFSYFLIGTVVGDVIFDIYLIENQKERNKKLHTKFIVPSLIIGLILIVLGVFIYFPNFIIHNSISSIIFSLGVLLTLLSILLFIEEREIKETKRSYKVFFYYSYYSFTIYLAHNALYFIFMGKLNAFNVWFVDIGSMILLTLLIRAIYKKFKEKLSLKIQIGRIAASLTKRFEEKRRKI